MAGHRSHRRLAAAGALLWAQAALADLVVIVHPDSPVQALTPRQVSDLYLGRTRTLGSQEETLPVLVYEQPGDSPVRERFYRALNGMDIRRLNAYWARLRFSGEVLPPAGLPDSRSVVEAVGRNRDALGYADAAALTPAVKVVLHLKE